MIPNTYPPKKKCIVCKKLFYKNINTSRAEWDRRQFCSISCASSVRIPWNASIKVDRKKYPTMGHFQKHSDKTKELISKRGKIEAKKRGADFFRKIQKKAIEVGKARGSYKGKPGAFKELNPLWKGNDASYSSKHKWIQKHWDKTGICEHCGEVPKSYGNRRWGTEWANKGNYDRERRDDWLELCKQCHRKYDGRF